MSLETNQHFTERQFPSSENTALFKAASEFATVADAMSIPYAVQGSMAYALNTGRDYRTIHDIDVYVDASKIDSLVNHFTNKLGYLRGFINNPRLQGRIKVFNGNISFDLVPAEFEDDGSFSAFTHTVGPVELIVYFPHQMVTSIRGITCLSAEGNYHRLQTSFASIIHGGSEISEHSLDLHALSTVIDPEKLAEIQQAGHGYYLRVTHIPQVRIPVATSERTIGRLMSLGIQKADPEFSLLQEQADLYIRSLQK